MRYSLTNEAPADDREYLFHPVSNPADAATSPWHWVEGRTPKALLIYAHPDDETLFAAGLMLAYPEWEWSLTRFVHGGNDRAEDHATAIDLLIEEYGVNVWNTRCLYRDDEYLDAAAKRSWYEEASKLDLAPDVVFTHGFRGEYGHQHHTTVHLIAHLLWDNVWDFYNVRPDPNEPQLVRGRVHVVPTGPEKRQIMETAYPAMTEAIRQADPDLYDALLSGRPEFYTR